MKRDSNDCHCVCAHNHPGQIGICDGKSLVVVSVLLPRGRRSRNGPTLGVPFCGACRRATLKHP